VLRERLKNEVEARFASEEGDFFKKKGVLGKDYPHE
jgi:hypothetical protein